MLKRLKLKFMMVAGLIMAIIGFGTFNQAMGAEVCKGLTNQNGWIRLGVNTTSDFTSGLLGTFETFNGTNVGGIDWLYNNPAELSTTLSTIFSNNELIGFGGQLISWWSEKNGRDTNLQVTQTLSGLVFLHVQIFDESCNEIKDFCDWYTPFDTHVYDLGNLITNAGQDISVSADAVLPGHEGIIVVTPVDGNFSTFGTSHPDCGTNEAIPWFGLTGNLRMIDSTNGIEYGTNVFARAVDLSGVLEQDITNGTFETGDLTGWEVDEGNVFAYQHDDFAPGITPPDGSNFAFLTTGPGDTGGGSYNGGDFPGLAVASLDDVAAADANVAILEQSFSALSPGVLTFDVSFLGTAAGANDFFVARVIDNFFGDVVSEKCISVNGGNNIVNGHGAGSAITTTPCQAAVFDGIKYVTADGSTFTAGRTAFIPLSLTVPASFFFDTDFTVQFIVADNAAADETGAIVDSVSLLTNNGCFSLDGSSGCKFVDVDPDFLRKDFSVVGTPPAAAADLVLMSFVDSYGPPYTVTPGKPTYSPVVFDEVEGNESCPALSGCFVRVGINDTLPPSENFTPAPTTPAPTTPPPPTTPPVTTAPPTKKSSGGGGCSIGGPVEVGTAMANVLVPLVPAFAIGFRVLRRKSKKNEK